MPMGLRHPEIWLLTTCKTTRDASSHNVQKTQRRQTLVSSCIAYLARKNTALKKKRIRWHGQHIHSRTRGSSLCIRHFSSKQIQGGQEPREDNRKRISNRIPCKQAQGMLSNVNTEPNLLADTAMFAVFQGCNCAPRGCSSYDMTPESFDHLSSVGSNQY